MNAWGCLILGVSWVTILTLCVFCFCKVMKTPRENIHAPLDIDTGDLDTEAGKK